MSINILIEERNQELWQEHDRSRMHRAFMPQRALLVDCNRQSKGRSPQVETKQLMKDPDRHSLAAVKASGHVAWSPSNY